MAAIHLTGGVHYLAETLELNTRDAFLTITSYTDEEVTVSGAVPLNITWEVEGEVRRGQFPGQCGDLYYGDYRMLKARSPNIADYGVNKHFGTGPYHTVSGFLVENEDCQVETNKFSQNCPDENKKGFYLNDEMSPDWADLDQTEVSHWNIFTQIRSIPLSRFCSSTPGSTSTPGWAV